MSRRSRTPAATPPACPACQEREYVLAHLVRLKSERLDLPRQEREWCVLDLLEQELRARKHRPTGGCT